MYVNDIAISPIPLVRGVGLVIVREFVLVLSLRYLGSASIGSELDSRFAPIQTLGFEGLSGIRPPMFPLYT